MATSRSLDLDLTIISAKHLKNVNWKNGDLKAYAVFWVDPDRRFATKSDDSGSTRPVWNERFFLPFSLPLSPESYLTLEIFHSKPSETPKPLVGTLRVGLNDLPDPDDSNRIRTFELTRPSGRPQGKIRIKLSVRERPLPPPQQDYRFTPPQNYYYNTATMPPQPPQPPRDYRYGTASPPPPPLPHHQYSTYHPESYTPYYSGYYTQAAPPPIPPRPLFDRSGYGGPSAPVEYSVPTTSYEQRQRGGKSGFGAGLGVGAVAGALGGLAIEEGLKYEEDKTGDRVERDVGAASHDDYSDYRVEY